MTLRYWATHKAVLVLKGFYEFLNRFVHRMITFQELRQCDCSPGFHSHGARVFRNGESFGERCPCRFTARGDVRAHERRLKLA